MMASPYLDLIQQDHDLHGWSQPLINHVDCTSNGNEVNISRLSNSSNEPQSPNPPPNPLMVQELGFHGSIQDNNLVYSETLQALYQPKIKEEISQETMQLSELYENNNSIHENYQMIDEKLLLRALQNSTHNIPVPLIQDFLPNNGGYINYNMVLPSVNILSSFPNPLPLPFPYIVDMDLHAFDLLASGRLNSKPMVREDPRFRLCEMQAVQGRPSSNHPKIPSLISGVVEPGGINSGVLEDKASHQTISKKSPLETRSPSFSSFKVRKEKLGDRIAALQQLVAPFGKTDTASVLMEAIGYIKFLQDQVETLSVPYLRSSKNKKQRITQVGSKEEKEQPKLDLRSRGLCLVPLSCTSYVTNENGGVWSPPNFHGN